MALRGIKLENIAQDLQDIAGVRIMVQFVDDVDEVLTLLRSRHDMTIIQERDYINNMKSSGYRSYHVIIEYPVDTIDGQKTVLAEIQIRTLAMNFWATIEHSLNYKYKGNFQKKSRNVWKSRQKLLWNWTRKCGKLGKISEKHSFY